MTKAPEDARKKQSRFPRDEASRIHKKITHWSQVFLDEAAQTILTAFPKRVSAFGHRPHDYASSV